MPVRRCAIVLFVLSCVAWFGPAHAQQSLLWDRTDRQPMIAPRADPVQGAPANVPSLFIGTSGYSLFAPYPERTVQVAVAPRRSLTPAGRVRDLIASAEAGRAGYDAVVWAARVKPPKAPTDMTVGEIYDWIAATPNQHHAIGRYQFIPATLRRLVSSVGAGRDQPFTPAFQDQLADVLLAEAGMHRFHAGQIGRVAFMNNLAKIWAGLPNSSGRSHYHGFAGNKATISWAAFSAEMAAIYPGSI